MPICISETFTVKVNMWLCVHLLQLGVMNRGAGIPSESVTSPIGPKNYASSALGASVYSHTGSVGEIPRSPESVLGDNVDDVWVAPAAPQSIVIKLPPHPPIGYVGWHVLHDYLTNPKECVVLSGQLPSCLTEVVRCSALPGSGVQLWELATPVPSSHAYLSLQILSTFGGNNTYVNRLYAFSEHPGASFAPKQSHLHTASMHSQNNNVTVEEAQISSLLKDLDSDIRLLHPLRLRSPQRARTVADYVEASMHEPPDLASTAPPLQRAHGASNVHHATSSTTPREGYAPHTVSPRQTSHYDPLPHRSLPQLNNSCSPQPGVGARPVADAALVRLQTLERSVMTLVHTMEDQKKDLGAIKSMLTVKQGAPNALECSGAPERWVATRTDAPTHRTTPFPDGALRSYVESILTERLSKYSRRTEQAIVARVDDHMQRILREVSVVVDERVHRHLHDLASTPARPASVNRSYTARSRSPSSYYTRVDPLSAPKRKEARAPHATLRDGRDTLY
jgi:hypothetical protein